MRGHHLLCALGFRGLGYSPAFAANMASILAALDAAPETAVAVTDGPDGICAAFPCDQRRHCDEAAVVARDRAVLAGLGLAPGDVARWGLLRTGLGRAFAPKDLQGLCATCRWLPLGFCQEGLARLRAAPGGPDAPVSSPPTDGPTRGSP